MNRYMKTRLTLSTLSIEELISWVYVKEEGMEMSCKIRLVDDYSEVAEIPFYR